MAIVFGLASALLWGVTDYLIRINARRVGVMRAMFWGQLPNLALMSVGLLLAAGVRDRALEAGAEGWALGLLSAFCSLGATACLYRALTSGVLALVAPIVASYAAVTAALSLITGQERLAAATVAGLAVCVLGVALASFSRAPRHGRSQPRQPKSHAFAGGIGWSLVSSLGYGVAFWIQGSFVVERLGPFAPVWLNALVGASTVGAVALVTRRSLAVPPRGTRWTLAGTGVLGSVAFLAYLAGLQTGSVAVVTVLSSLAGAVTVLLAFVLLRERLAPRQWAGVAAALAGVVTLNLAG